MVGGSGLYIDGVIYDFGFLKEGDRIKRSVLNELSIEQLLQKIKEIGYSVEGVDIRNKRRLIRLLETAGQRPTSKGLRLNTVILGLQTPRETLEERIKTRVENMVKAGLEQEVKDLSAKYGWG